MGNECEWALPFCSMSVERGVVGAPVAIDDVDSFGRHRRLHEHFPRIISGGTTVEGSGEGEREGRSEHPTSFECPPHRERSHVLGNAHWRTTTQHETPLSPTAADKKSERFEGEG